MKHTIVGKAEAALVPASLMPEFIRPADAQRLFSISRSTLFEWTRAGWVKSHLVRRPGNKSGIRLVSTASLRSFITKAAA